MEQLLLRSLVLSPIILFVLTGPPRRAEAADTFELRANSPIERTLSGGQQDTFTIRLKKNQWLKAVAEQKGLDVVVQVVSPQGKVLATIDGPDEAVGPEPISWLATESGEYRIVIKPFQADAKPAKYEMRLIGVRSATRAELQVAAAERDARQAEADWITARNSNDESAMRAMAAGDYSRYSFGGPATGLDTVLQQQRDQVNRDRTIRRKLQPDDVSLRAYSDTVLVSGHMSAITLRDGRESKFPMLFEHLWRRENGKWRLAVEQMFAAPPDREKHRVVHLPEGLLRGYVGRYAYPSGTVFFLEPVGDHLGFHTSNSPAGTSIELFPENDSEFFNEDGALSLTFVRDAQGKIIHAVLATGLQVVRLTPGR